ncbi:hypothetical protein BU14_0136s0002 [Porphyra umbilicalis]|uniref:Uncharacterized protein n=1 Tax=Porphyra umbilicalis TaxID=2786 RepID=A0A1X6PA09_PORUM|nr:hypothetical protein BU14_0136s0002 [Porphyra umbilicalis]|eukprot:OSX77704.1 hypothetical protein BU14_0136s0002 [Porphyra umbilicalis]
MAVNLAGRRACSDGEEERTTACFRLTDGDVGRPGSGSAGGDEVPPAPATGTDSAAKGKQHRRRLKDTHALRVVRGTRAAKDYVAPRGKIMEPLEKAAAIFNDHPQARFVVTVKVLSDGFKLLKYRYLSEEKKDAESTGFEQEVTELDTLLCDVVPAAVDYDKKLSKDREEATRLEEKLVAEGESIWRMAMEWRQKRLRSGGSEDREGVSGRQAASGSPIMATSVATCRRRRRVETRDEDDVVVALPQNEKRRDAMALEQLEPAERRLEQELQFHQEETARRDRIDTEHREERAAHLPLAETLLRKLG